ncbi:MAG: hypothetical protein HC771_24445 [Synechococcales cyanobacterium CRU_2_2]|nr:hypothetical protein [Synechococcales cyanobacterium CRU_2_2]
MPLPDNFSPVEHFQDTIKRTYNREVREWFSDLDPDELGIETPRASLRTACTHQEDDSLPVTLGRMQFFDMVVARKFSSLGGEDEKSPPYSLNRRGKPVIKLYFTEDYDDVEIGYQRVKGQISFRLMSQTVEGLTNAEAIQYGNRIKTAFGSAGGFIWQKGKILASYADWEKGYQLQLLVRTEAEAKRVIEQVLDIQQHSPDWEYLSYKVADSPSQAYPTIPPTQIILGKSRRLARRRPTANVRFKTALLFVPGLASPIALYDRSGAYPEALVPL